MFSTRLTEGGIEIGIRYRMVQDYDMKPLTAERDKKTAGIVDQDRTPKNVAKVINLNKWKYLSI